MTECDIIQGGHCAAGNHRGSIVWGHELSWGFSAHVGRGGNVTSIIFVSRPFFFAIANTALGRCGLYVHEYTLGTNPLWVQGFPVLQRKLGVTFCLIIPGPKSRAQARKPCAQVTSVDFSELCKYLFLCLFWEKEHLWVAGNHHMYFGGAERGESAVCS